MQENIDSSARSVLRRIIHAAWRRRYLLIVPVLVMLPASILAAMVLPGTYKARTLMLLQESARSNPLSADTVPTSERLQERIAGLRALLFSDYVLGQIVDEFGAQNDDPKQRAGRIQDLRRSLAIDSIGNDFLEIQLSGTVAKGLGHQLDRVASRFMETLIAQGGTSVGEMLISKRRQELELAEQTQADLARQLENAQPADYDKLERELIASRQAVSAAQEVVEAYKRRLGHGAAVRGASILAAPERIIIVDPPRDPEFRSVPRSMIVLYGLVASLILGAGLAFAAEMIDGTVRDPNGIVAMTGVPIIARLPDGAFSSAEQTRTARDSWDRAASAGRTRPAPGFMPYRLLASCGRGPAEHNTELPRG